MSIVVRDIRGNLEVSRKLTEDIDYSTQATMALTNDVSQKINVIEGFARSIGDNVKASRYCTQLILNPGLPTYRLPLFFCLNRVPI